MRSPTGSLIAGRYSTEAELSRGGMGVVYRVHDLHTGRTCALKRARAGREEGALGQTRALKYEYQLLHSLRHPRIIRVYDYGDDHAGPYYTMELLDGTDLRHLAPMAWREACRALRDVASSLALMHARGLVHRDVSPGNVRVTHDGHAKLLDFGTVARVGKQATAAGTAPCVAPEMLDGEALDAAVDVYALAASAYFALCGAYPYPARSFAQLHALWAAGRPDAPSAVCPEVPRELDELVMSSLALDPAERPAVAVWIDQLGAIAQLPDDNERSCGRELPPAPTVGRPQ
jgi:eukaryotic-like serine/threonine-protein kinase